LVLKLGPIFSNIFLNINACVAVHNLRLHEIKLLVEKLSLLTFDFQLFLSFGLI
jgi:hypothetical protein